MPNINDNNRKCTHDVNHFPRMYAWTIGRTCDGYYDLQIIEAISVDNATND